MMAIDFHYNTYKHGLAKITLIYYYLPSMGLQVKLEKLYTTF